MAQTVAQLIADHASLGREFEALGVRSHVMTSGAGPDVVLMHGLPSSSYLYRKVIAGLAARGFRASCFDLPGLGLAARPVDFDYTFTGLGAFATAAVDQLGLGRFHLVVHDAGGPVGFELAASMPDRIRSLTLLNTVVDVGASMPFAMELYARVAKGDRWPAMPRASVTRRIMYKVGVGDRTAVTDAEMDVYRELVLREDDGRAYLRIMGGLDRSRAKAELYASVVDGRRQPYPVQVVWGVNDPILDVRSHGLRALRLTGVPYIHAIGGKHYFQEDHGPEISALVADFAARTDRA